MIKISLFNFEEFINSRLVGIGQIIINICLFTAFGSKELQVLQHHEVIKNQYPNVQTNEKDKQ